METKSMSSQGAKKWIKSFLVVIVAMIGFSYLHTHGISPIWAAVTIVLFPGFFRFIYKIACLIVSILIIFGILSYLIY